MNQKDIINTGYHDKPVGQQKNTIKFTSGKNQFCTQTASFNNLQLNNTLVIQYSQYSKVSFLQIFFFEKQVNCNYFEKEQLYNSEEQIQPITNGHFVKSQYYIPNIIVSIAVQAGSLLFIKLLNSNENLRVGNFECWVIGLDLIKEGRNNYSTIKYNDCAFCSCDLFRTQKQKIGNLKCFNDKL